MVWQRASAACQTKRKRFEVGVEEGRTARPRRMPVRAMATVAAREMRVVWSKRSGGRVSENAMLVDYTCLLGWGGI